MQNDLPFFLAQNTGLGQAVESDELLHPQYTGVVTDDSLSETQYFGISIPDQRIHGLGYLWHRPNLKIITGGIWVFQGIKDRTLDAEMFDMRAFMRDTALANDLHEYRLDNGYGVRIIEPLKRHQMTYEDAARGNRVDLEFSAVTPPVMFGDGKHFEQGMRVRGEIALRGKTYRMDGTTIRDRSFGKPRPERSMTKPPLSWMVSVFNDEFAFNCNMFDHVGSNAQATGAFAVPQDGALNGGWVWRNGRVTRIVSARKRVEREAGSLLPKRIELELIDEQGNTLRMDGRLVASCPWTTWPNLIFANSLMRWECDGHVGYGDCQEALWTDYLLAHGGAPG